MPVTTAAIIKLTDVSLVKLSRWRTRHFKKCPKTDYTAYDLIFTPTGLGDHIKAKCKTCGVVEDISDYDSW